MKAAHGIYKKSPARKSDYLAANNIEMTDDDSSMAGEWEILTRLLKVIEMMVKFLREYKAAKTFPAKDERFTLFLQSTTWSIFPAYCEFSLSVARDMEPFLTLFQDERPLVVCLCD